VSDSAFTRALGAAARRGREAGVCPDAEQLAAFVDGVLPREEREAVVAHAADCARCTEHLGMLLPIAGARPVPERRRPFLEGWLWLVPVATAVLLVAVWVRLPDPAQTSSPDGGPQRHGEHRDSHGESSAPAGEDSGEAQSPAVMSAPAPEAHLRPQPEGPVMQAPESDASGAIAPLTDLRRTSPQKAAPGSPPAAQMAERKPGAESAPAGERLTIVDAPPEPGQAGAITAGRARAGAESPSAPRPQAAGDGAAAPSARVFRFEAGAPQSLRVESGGALYRATGSRLERSLDSGTTWTALVENAGSAFTAGACAPDGGCWFGTAGGVMVRHTDDATTRTHLPETAAVTDVAAASATHAEVTLATGDRLRTTDGGTTWQPVRP
jgi:hypothetical protein